MVVSNSWLVNINVSIQTAQVQAPDFNQSMLLGVMPLRTAGYQCPPESWGANNFQVYTSATQFSNDFTFLVNAAFAVSDFIQANRFQWLINAVNAYFSQPNSPLTITVGAMAPPTSATNYSNILNNLSLANNNWYGFSICDLILAQSYSTLNVMITTSGPGTIPAGVTLTSESSVPTYFLPQPFTAAAAGNYTLTFYSKDATTPVSENAMTGLSTPLSFISLLSQSSASNNSIPGLMTPISGVSPALTNFRSTANNNPKFLFQDTIDPTTAADVQLSGGNKALAIFCHSLNFPSYNVTNSSLLESLSAANLGAYFGNLFNAGVGMKPLSSMQLTNQNVDPIITTANIGTPGSAGNSNNLIGWNNNVFAGFGAPPGIGLMQYGFVSSSTANQLLYIDQVVGTDFIQLTAQADLVSYIINQQPFGGILYSDVGIQQILSVFKSSVQKAVAQNIIQQPLNSAFVYKNYINVDKDDVTNRIYKDLYFNGQFLNRIQQISIQVNLSL